MNDQISSRQQTVAEGLASVRQCIAEAARAVGRDPASITLVAVTKTHDAAVVEAALSLGQTVFAENRVQEAEAKYPALKAAHPGLKLHLIGPLQTNKVKEAVRLFDVIETVDRPKLAESLSREMERSGRHPNCFIQVNTGEEPQKAGILPKEAPGFIEACRDQFKLRVRGLMCIPPVAEEPSPHFAFLRELARRHGVAELSMGMSADFEIAIRLGATHVRIGTAIFGQRPVSGLA